MYDPSFYKDEQNASMADRGDTHYHVPTLNNWFLISSLLLVSIAWMVIDDWNAPWKNYQRVPGH